MTRLWQMPVSVCLSRLLREHLGEKEVQLSLTFDAVEEVDLANYTCYVENHIGRRGGSAILQRKGTVLPLYLSPPRSTSLFCFVSYVKAKKCFNADQRRMPLLWLFKNFQKQLAGKMLNMTFTFSKEIKIGFFLYQLVLLVSIIINIINFDRAV